MNNLYDKILFLVALALLGGGVAFYMVKQTQLPSPHVAPPDRVPTGEAVTPIELQTFQDDVAVIPTPSAQDAEGFWIFNLFTPPRIWWSDEIGWIAEPPGDNQPCLITRLFGVELVSVDQGLYPVQFKGYTGGTQMGEPVLLEITVRNEEGVFENKRVSLEATDEAPVEFRDFEVKREIDEGERGTVIRSIGYLTIFDPELGEEVVLRDDVDKVIEGVFEVTLRKLAPPFKQEEVFTWERIGDTQKFYVRCRDTNFNVDYTLLDLDPAEATATIEKAGTAVEEPVVRTLQAVGSAAPAAPQPPAETEEEPEEEETPPAGNVPGSLFG